MKTLDQKVRPVRGLLEHRSKFLRSKLTSVSGKLSVSSPSTEGPQVGLRDCVQGTGRATRTEARVRPDPIMIYVAIQSRRD